MPQRSTSRECSHKITHERFVKSMEPQIVEIFMFVLSNVANWTTLEVSELQFRMKRPGRESSKRWKWGAIQFSGKVLEREIVSYL